MIFLRAPICLCAHILVISTSIAYQFKTDTKFVNLSVETGTILMAKKRRESSRIKNAAPIVNRAINDVLHYGFDDVVKRPLFHHHFELDMLRKEENLVQKLKKGNL